MAGPKNNAKENQQENPKINMRIPLEEQDDFYRLDPNAQRALLSQQAMLFRPREYQEEYNEAPFRFDKMHAARILGRNQANPSLHGNLKDTFPDPCSLILDPSDKESVSVSDPVWFFDSLKKPGASKIAPGFCHWQLFSKDGECTKAGPADAVLPGSGPARPVPPAGPAGAAARLEAARQAARH